MVNIFSKAESGPIDGVVNRPSNQLVHRHRKGKWIRGKEREELAMEKYQINGKGITFFDVVEKYRCSKPKAQRKLKNASSKYKTKTGVQNTLLFTLERRKPQQYFPSCIKATIIENKRNRLIDPTGVNYNNKASHNPLHNAIEQQQIVQSFLTQLYLLPFQPLNMHNTHLWTFIDKSHYEEINQKPYSEENKTKMIREWIGSREVIYHFNKKGSIQIEISCSKNPFPIETSYDVFNFFGYLGQVKERLAIILSDPRERIVQPVDNWILKYCDFNKDIGLDDRNEQLMSLNIQVKHMGEAFRLYVKNLESKFALRGEKTMKVNQPITTFLNDAILNPYHLIENKFAELYDVMGKNYLDLKDRIEGKSRKMT